MTQFHPQPVPRTETSGPKARRPRIRFFGQLIIAFAVVILLAGGGTLLAGRFALSRLESFARENPSVAMRFWVDRLSRHYARQGDWDGVDDLIASYPCGPGWGPWDQGWQGEYTVATPDGVIVSASDEELVGQTLSPPQSTLATPIVVDDRPVGLLLLSPFVRPEVDLRAMLRFALNRFLLTGLAVGGFALIAGLGLSRLMSRPVVRLTEATRAVAAGDLDVRVPDRYRGEIGELASAFNRMAEELARADELRRNLTADVAHELRTPLSVIRGKLEGVLDGVYPAAPEHLEPILDETQVLIHLVEDLRLLALAEAGQLSLDRRPMDVGDLLRDAQVNFGPQAADRGVTLALDLPSELPRVVADWRRVSQVLGNLLTNALRHTPQGGCVTLSAAVVSSPAKGTEGSWVHPLSPEIGQGVVPKRERFVNKVTAPPRDSQGIGRSA